MQGISTLWGSFEILNHRLVKKMLCQLAGKDLAQYPEEFQSYAEQFERNPMYFLNFFGSTDLKQVIDAMDYAVYVYDVRHVIIDNLQFMLSGQGKGFERFDNQDLAIETFRKFATEKNIHITLVIHPKKVDDDEKLRLSSIFGSAKATQEADNVFVFQRNDKFRFISILKNRFDGELGTIPYKFDRFSSRINELNDEEIDQVESGSLILDY
jgi:twinkle protein